MRSPGANRPRRTSACKKESLEQTPLEENIKVVTNLPRDLPPVSVDPEQIKRVVCNLIVNTAQAMSGGETLTIETARAGGGTQVVVSDTGEDIARENLEKIFQPPFWSIRPDRPWKVSHRENVR